MLSVLCKFKLADGRRIAKTPPKGFAKTQPKIRLVAIKITSERVGRIKNIFIFPFRIDLDTILILKDSDKT